MLITKTNPLGIDKAIQQLQTKLHTYLVSEWGLESDAYHCHGRCYRNKYDSGYVAEVFNSDATTGAKDYKEVFFNDNLTALSFFSVGERVDSVMGASKASVSVIFFVNVSQVKTDVTHRADEEIRLDVLKFFQGPTLLGYETGVDNVLKEFPGSKVSEGLKTVDMHPKHCFKINLLLNYQNC